MAGEPPRGALTKSGSLADHSKASIFVVDDDMVIRKMLQRWLQMAGYQVLSLPGAKEAWEAINDGRRVDLVLCDVTMPEFGGFWLLEHIHKSKKFTHIPVILMSAVDKTGEAADKSIDGGSEDYLYKPLAKKVLLKKVSTILENFFRKAKIMSLEKKVTELDRIRTEARAAVETPIQSITKTLSSLLSDDSIKKSHIGDELRSLMVAMSKTDLYKPQFERLVKKSSIDPVAQSWLVANYTEDIVASEDAKDEAESVKIVTPSDKVDLTAWDFSQWEYSEDDLLGFLKSMFLNFGLVKKFSIPIKKLDKFLVEVRSRYKPNPYHNFRHAFDVTQTVYSLLTNFGGVKYLTHLESLAALIGALCHDMGHPGKNNNFLVKTGDPLALNYNDIAVLENFHASSCWQILRNPDSNILENLTTAQKPKIRSLIIKIILQTDMAQHFEFLSKLQQRLKGEPFSKEEDDDRLMIMRAIMKAADISNVAKPWNISKEWSDRVSEEFFLQGDEERKRGMTPDPFTDRTKVTKAKNTANFIDYVARAYWETMEKVLPKMKVCVALVNANREKLEKLMLDEKKET